MAVATESLNPIEIAHELMTRAGGNHRAAEVEAWKLRQAHGPESSAGRSLATAAFMIADWYFDKAKKRDINDLGQYNVPVFAPGPNSVTLRDQ